MTPLPAGFRLCADRHLRRYDGDRVLVGGMPARVLRLSDRGAEVAHRLLAGDPVEGAAAAALARRLLDAGLAQPVPPADTTVSLAVVVPSYDDPVALDRCLDALGDAVPVTVVDDGSADAEAVAAVAKRHGATLHRHASNRGPAAARNRGAHATDADVIAFVDTDVIVDADTLRALVAHFADPHVSAVAPRVRPLAAAVGGLRAFADVSSPLDMGSQSAAVRHDARVRYVPSTVLLVRRTALEAVAGFAESLRYGEDVDLVWRLADAGGSVRYVADRVVHHVEPTTWPDWLSRRFRYGTSAGALAERHGVAAVSLSLPAAPAAAVLLVAVGRRRMAAAVTVLTGARLAMRLRGSGVPVVHALRATAVAPVAAGLATARWATQLWAPVLVVTALRSRRPAVLAIAAAPPLVTWVARRPKVGPIRWLAMSVADDLAYGVGVWVGAVRRRRLGVVLPRIR